MVDELDGHAGGVGPLRGLTETTDPLIPGRSAATPRTERARPWGRVDLVVVGAGHIGYPLALLAARAGRRVLAVDIDPRVVDAINAGRPPINEPGIPELAADAGVRERLRASTQPAPADVYVIAVPTPLALGGEAADLSMVEAAVRAIRPVLRPGALLIVESTVPPGTCRGLVASILAEVGLRAGTDVRLAHCPERILPGAILDELVGNDRVIGGVDPASTEAALGFYAGFVEGKLIPTDDLTAEFCKLAENTFRDVNIALANELAALASAYGVDGLEALDLANRHPRVDILQPGIGVGGHCIPIDPWFLIRNEPSRRSVLIEVARAVNNAQPDRVAGRIRAEVADVADPRVLAIGAAYKPNVADTRKSPALAVVDRLRASGVDTAVYDPLVVGYDGDLVARAAGTDLVAVLVPHTVALQQLVTHEPRLVEVMRTPRILDYSTGDPRPVPGLVL